MGCARSCLIPEPLLFSTLGAEHLTQHLAPCKRWVTETAIEACLFEDEGGTQSSFHKEERSPVPTGGCPHPEVLFRRAASPQNGAEPRGSSRRGPHGAGGAHINPSAPPGGEPAIVRLARKTVPSRLFEDAELLTCPRGNEDKGVTLHHCTESGTSSIFPVHFISVLHNSYNSMFKYSP